MCILTDDMGQLALECHSKQRKEGNNTQHNRRYSYEAIS